jgi:hypothetical protein
LEQGLAFVALPVLGLLVALLVCELVQWLVGSGWRQNQVPPPRDKHALALRDAIRERAEAAAPVQPAWQRSLQQFLTTPQAPRLG